MDSAKELAGKAAIITGAARNQGRAYARALAAKGTDVTVHYHTDAARADAEETAQLVKVARPAA